MEKATAGGVSSGGRLRSRREPSAGPGQDLVGSGWLSEG